MVNSPVLFEPDGQQLYQKETPTRVFSSEYREIFKNSLLIEQLWWLIF